MFSDFSALIAEITRILTVDSSGRIITAIQPVVAIGFTLSLIMMGTLSTFQVINNPLGEVLRKFFNGASLFLLRYLQLIFSHILLII